MTFEKHCGKCKEAFLIKISTMFFKGHPFKLEALFFLNNLPIHYKITLNMMESTIRYQVKDYIYFCLEQTLNGDIMIAEKLTNHI